MSTPTEGNTKHGVGDAVPHPLNHLAVNLHVIVLAPAPVRTPTMVLPFSRVHIVALQ